MALALGHHNQPDSWWSGRVGVIVEARARGEDGAGGGVVPLFESIDKKIPK